MGIRSLSAFLSDFGWPKVIGLFTAMRDKKFATMLAQIAHQLDTIILTRVEPSHRCATSEQLIQAASAVSIPHRFQQDLPSAFLEAQDLAIEKNLPLVIFGSMYLIGAVMKPLLFKNREDAVI